MARNPRPVLLNCAECCIFVRDPVIEEQTADEALTEDEASVEPSQKVMEIPLNLVPKVRELIAKHQN